MPNEPTSLENFNLMDPALQQCPYGFYEVARAEAPVYRMPQTGFYLVTSFALCNEVIRQPDVYASGVSPMALKPDGVPQEIIDVYVQQGWLPLASCSTSDPPVHTRVRSFLEPLFTTRRMQEIRPLIERTAVELVDAIGTRTEIDFVGEFAHPLPMIVIAELIGVPKADLGRFKAWSDAIVEPFSMMVSAQRELECARLVVEMQHYFAKAIEARRRAPRSDLLSALVSAAEHPDRHFSLQEQLTIITIDLLASGNETTTAAIASGLLLLIRDPAALAAVQADRTLVANLTEEILRLESPAQGMFRRVTQPTVLGGVPLKPGDILSVRFGAANRDAAQFAHADRIDLQRKPPGKHLALGIGRHHCIGAQLARQEISSAFNVLLDRYEGFAMTPGRPEPAYQASFFGRNLRELWLTLKPR
jgi:cytochrome P450